jgi:hypothetical protein
MFAVETWPLIQDELISTYPHKTASLPTIQESVSQTNQTSRIENGEPERIDLSISYRAITRRNCARKVLNFGLLDVFRVSQFLIPNYPFQ